MFQLLDTLARLDDSWHWLTTQNETVSGVNRFFMTLRRQPRPSLTGAHAAIAQCLEGQACITGQRLILEEALHWPLAYALAWLSVAGGNSVMPPGICWRKKASGLGKWQAPSRHRKACDASRHG